MQFRLEFADAGKIHRRMPRLEEYLLPPVGRPVKNVLVVQAGNAWNEQGLIGACVFQTPDAVVTRAVSPLRRVVANHSLQVTASKQILVHGRFTRLEIQALVRMQRNQKVNRFAPRPVTSFHARAAIAGFFRMSDSPKAFGPDPHDDVQDSIFNFIRWWYWLVVVLLALIGFVYFPFWQFEQRWNRLQIGDTADRLKELLGDAGEPSYTVRGSGPNSNQEVYIYRRYGRTYEVQISSNTRRVTAKSILSDATGANSTSPGP
jgi:hypothetical protein